MKKQNGIKNKEEKVAQLAEYILTDYVKYSSCNYLNLSADADKNQNVESAVVAQLAEHLPYEQESSQTSGFEVLTRIPATAPT